ncbi:substrate-binding periplasmic protein [Chromobacterium alticapitis]|uniref:Uncharacterized protein n=1 Tax=Chromobacterium alticapitis TaxID=2073169 RepID=A0A2S5DBQ9_9NEIS|nr:transporter substrate-binding domain-containing protein [Chromobacterium alticapitis]POZ60432.1 hypothetical protein C2I19_19025 [Chromobacterium alticapitis]
MATPYYPDLPMPLPLSIQRGIHLFLLSIWAAASALAAPVQAETVPLRCAPSGELYHYRWALLQLALDHANTGHADYRVDQIDSTLTSQSRLEAMLRAGAVDVLALGPNQERLAELQPVRVDILRGLLGYRVLLIRKADQARFRQLSPSELKRQIRFGFNSQWADVAILQANGLTLVTSPSYPNLFAMLSNKRFDAFPRGVSEFAKELASYGHAYPDLGVDDSHALFMRYPVYFWVRKGNAELAKRIEDGLNLALRDGSFKKLFQQYHQPEIQLLKQERRSVLYLENPMFPGPPLPHEYSWWLPSGIKLHPLP